MLEELVELLRMNKVIKFSSVNDAKSRVAFSVNKYLNKFPGLCSVELSDALVKIFGKEFIFERNRYCARHISLPSVNEYLRNSTNFYHLKIQDALRKVMELGNWEVAVSSMNRGEIIYYKKDSDLHQYLTPRIKELKRIVHYEFSIDPFEK